VLLNFRIDQIGTVFASGKGSADFLKREENGLSGLPLSFQDMSQENG
jgi:hypothetical protein